MLFCSQCKDYRPHTYKGRNGVKDAYCSCGARNYVVVTIHLADGEEKTIVLDAITGAIHN